MSTEKGRQDSQGDPLTVKREPGVDDKAISARTALRPSVRAAITARAYSKQFGLLDLTSLVDELAAQNAAVSNGEMARSEGMLMSQAHTLEAIFHELARRAAINLGECINSGEIYMRLALKAQSQCRATLETLGTIKNPAPVTFVKQANVAHGPQQVNNGTEPPGEPSRARESENPPNRLLEQQGNEWLDTGTTQAAVGAGSAVEPVGEVHGAANAAR